MNIILLHKITRSYPMGNHQVKALNAISFSIREGDFAAVAGPSGAGKTTIMNIIGLIDRPTSGRVEIAGRDTAGLSDNQLTALRHETLGFIFQSFNLMPVLNVAENIELPLLLGKTSPPKAERREWVEHLMEEVGLAEWRTHRPRELSGGQRQRVAIARALAGKPRIVIADEPTANLDSKTGESILNLMKKINREENTTFVFSTHDEAIRQMAGHVITLRDGGILSEERPSP